MFGSRDELENKFILLLKLFDGLGLDKIYRYFN
jgi:hypothetical protein